MPLTKHLGDFIQKTKLKAFIFMLTKQKNCSNRCKSANLEHIKFVFFEALLKEAYRNYCTYPQIEQTSRHDPISITQNIMAVSININVGEFSYRQS